MVEINLLPWREYIRVKKRKHTKIVMTVLVIFSLGFIMSMHWVFKKPPVPNIPPVVYPEVTSDQQLTRQLQQIKFVGYLHQAARIWAILLMPDGVICDVHAGSVIQNQVRIAAISEAQVILLLPNQSKLKIPLSQE